MGGALTETRSTQDPLIAQVGARVRAARESKGIARRVLSDMSGVSPRYLAQLEAGDGNISIGLLKKVAVALDQRIEWFIGEDDPWPPEVMRFAGLFRGATPEVQAQVMALLQPDAQANVRGRRICLIGLRGAGKSTLGAAVSDGLGLPFIELNQQIAEEGGMEAAEILALYGQEGYRRLEAAALAQIAEQDTPLVLAAAGGIVAEPETFATLLTRFHTVWIKAAPQEHMDRVRAQGDMRPMSGNPEAMTQLRSILTAREALYERAEAVLDTSGKTLETSVAELKTLIQSRGWLA